MNKDSALKLALEALEDYVEEYGPHEKDSGAAYVMTAIKEALANAHTSDTSQERVDETAKQRHEQEPVEYQYRTRPDWITEWNGWNTCSKESAEAYEKNPYLHDWHYEVRRLYTTPPAQSEQEPFEYWNAVEGWVKIDEVRKHFDSVGCGTIYKSAGEGRAPLYTTPQQRTWQGLTDEEFSAIYSSSGTPAVAMEKVEAKLREKNT